MDLRPLEPMHLLGNCQFRKHAFLARLALALMLQGIIGCGHQQGTPIVNTDHSTNSNNTQPTVLTSVESTESDKHELATFGAGCFWCVEAVFQQLKGVESVMPGYAGGTIPNPTYKQVCTGTTGHAEVCQIKYDPSVISYKELLEVFWKTHDPTTLNRQGADAGTQYRSAVFYHNDEQRQLATEYKEKLDASGAFDKKIVTEIVPLTKFYPAEDYHKDYYLLNPNAGYCNFVIRPKVEKFRAVFHDKLKPAASDGGQEN